MITLRSFLASAAASAAAAVAAASFSRVGLNRLRTGSAIHPSVDGVRNSGVTSIWKPKRAKAMKFDLTGKAGFPAAVAVDSHNLCSKLKSSQRYLKFWDKEKIKKNCVSRKDAKAP